MSGYTPLFSSIVTSSIWSEDDETRLIWITMLALADAQGIVEGSIPGLAHVARVSITGCEKAIQVLSSPDKYSRTADNEGKRIHKVAGGWQIYNHAAFRNKAKSRAEYMRKYRERKKEERSKEEKKETNTNTNTNTNKVTLACTVNSNVTCYTLQNILDIAFKSSVPEDFAKRYFNHYDSQNWSKGNGQTITKPGLHMKELYLKDPNMFQGDKSAESIEEKHARLKAEGLIK